MQLIKFMVLHVSGLRQGCELIGIIHKNRINTRGIRLQVAAYRAIYGPHHPLLGLQLYTLGNLYTDIGQVIYISVVAVHACKTTSSFINRHALRADGNWRRCFRRISRHPAVNSWSRKPNGSRVATIAFYLQKTVKDLEEPTTLSDQKDASPEPS